MVSWEEHKGEKEDLVTVPNACVNAWSYNQDTKAYQADKSHLNPLWNHKKGPVWARQFRPSSIKQIQKTEQ
eukprot:5727203-Ditylum_brightwellii.AAC.1